MTVELGAYQLEIAVDFGPRITSLRRGDGPEQLATLGREVALDHEGRRFEFRGGHRLWAAPEDPAITYAPDDHDCEVVESHGAVEVSAPPDSVGLVKRVSISEAGDDLIVDHRMSLAPGSSNLTLAAWAITQLRMGGTAIVPFRSADRGPRADRYLVFWPYTSIEDRRMSLYDEAVELEASEGPQLKLGVGPAPGRLGYYRDGTIFIKEIEPVGSGEVPDFGAAGQVYIGQGFCELESVGRVTDLADGAEAVLRERWAVRDCADLDAAVQLTLG